MVLVDDEKSSSFVSSTKKVLVGASCAAAAVAGIVPLPFLRVVVVVVHPSGWKHIVDGCCYCHDSCGIVVCWSTFLLGRRQEEQEGIVVVIVVGVVVEVETVACSEYHGGSNEGAIIFVLDNEVLKRVDSEERGIVGGGNATKVCVNENMKYLESYRSTIQH